MGDLASSLEGPCSRVSALRWGMAGGKGEQKVALFINGTHFKFLTGWNTGKMAHQTQDDIHQLWGYFLIHSLIQQIVTEGPQGGHSSPVLRDGDRSEEHRQKCLPAPSFPEAKPSMLHKLKTDVYFVYERAGVPTVTLAPKSASLKRQQPYVTVDGEIDAWLLSRNYLEHRSS